MDRKGREEAEPKKREAHWQGRKKHLSCETRRPQRQKDGKLQKGTTRGNL
jgi:hypothetical protein